MLSGFLTIVIKISHNLFKGERRHISILSYTTVVAKWKVIPLITNYTGTCIRKGR